MAEPFRVNSGAFNLQQEVFVIQRDKKVFMESVPITDSERMVYSPYNEPLTVAVVSQQVYARFSTQESG